MKINTLPHFVRIAVMNHDGWIVGGGARYLLGEEKEVKDWDILIPFYEWGKICLLIPDGAVKNTFGGFKFTDKDNNSIDIWCGDIGWFMVNCTKEKSCYAVNPWKGIKLVSDKL